MRWLIAATVAIVAIVAGLIPYFFLDSPLGSGSASEQKVRCLKKNEIATYEVLESGRPGKVRVSVVDTIASSTVWSRDFAIPSTTHVHSYEIRDCHFYLHKRSGFDPAGGVVSPGYFWSLWRYLYFSEDEGREVVLFADNKTGTREDSRTYYGTDFSVAPDERVISLERSHLGKDDYALAIKNIETGLDEYVLPLSEVLKDHPDAVGSFDVGTWVTRPDGVYLSTIIYDGSRWMAYIYVKQGTWETEIYETPKEYLPGVERAAPPFAPFLAYTDVIVWAGFDTVTETLLEEQIAAGQRKHLIVANLKTGEETVLEEVPIIRDHRFQLTWLSDTELEYTMPDGTKRAYTVK